MESKTLIHRIEYWAQQKPKQGAIYQKISGEWKETTWEQYYQNVRDIAKGLIALGHQKDECVSIISNNRSEYLWAQFGIVAAAGIPAPIYQTCNAEQIAYIVDHSKSRFVFVEDKEQYTKLEKQRNDLNIEKVISFEPLKDFDDSWAITLEQLMELGKQQSDEVLQSRIDSLTRESIAILIYTSGTTGTPKAVILTQNNLISTADICLQRFDLSDSRVVSYLPLSHIAEQVITNLSQLKTGGQVYMCSDLKHIKDYLSEVRPTIFLGVPRIWEKFAQAMQSQFAKVSGGQKKLLKWALKTELKYFKRQIESNKEVKSLARNLANKLVLKKIRDRIGFTCLELAVTGAAPIGVDVLEFFASMGITIHEVYGMSETCGIISISMPNRPRFGTVGKPFDGVEVKIAEDGEIIVRGPAMSQGYLHDDEKTAELWEGGWLHTGDIGVFDDDGHLRITDRKKDLIITAGGKNVAPQQIEKLLSSIPGIHVPVVIGDRRKYLVALLTLEIDEAKRVARTLGISDDSTEAISKNAEFNKYITDKINTVVNSQLAQYQTIKKFAILPNEFSVETGEFTPTMKVKRKVVNEKYHDVIESLY